MLLEPLYRNASQQPNQPAVIDESGVCTHAQLLGKATALATLIQSRTTQSAVGILLPAGLGFVTSFYGTLLAGKTPVPINFLLGPREVAHIIKDSGFDLLIAHPALSAKLQGLGITILDITQVASMIDPSAKLTESPHTDEDVAALLYTSGTSGLPKGVPLTHRNIETCAKSCIQRAFAEGEFRFLGIVPLFHSTGMIVTLIAPMELGSPVVYISRFSPVATIKAIREHKINVMVAVPSMYGALLRLKDAHPEDFAPMYMAISGGEPLPSVIRENALAKFNLKLMEGYGLTETSGPLAFNMPTAYRPGAVGKVIDIVRCRIADDGEIQVKGSPIMKGYHNLPDATQSVMTPDGFFRTGDIGKIDEDGYLFITGRIKDLIIVSGEKVYPRELEELMATHPDVGQIAIVGRPDASRGEVVVAFVVAKEGHTLTPESLKQFCREKDLPNWKTPRDVHVVKELPHSPTGKILKRELVEQAKQLKSSED